LADSSVGPVGIAVLLFWSLSAALRSGASVRSLGIFALPLVAESVIQAVLRLGAAWLLSRYVYGAGPFDSLAKCGAGLAGKKNA